MAELERSLGLATTTLLGVGVILGAGIYALVGKATGLAGEAVWLSFVGAALVAGLTGLSYAELAAAIPRAGAEYHYARRAFGPLVAFLVSWLLLAGLAVASGAVALGFGGYLAALAELPTVAGGLLCLAACTALACWGTRETAAVAVLCTLLEVGGLLVVLVVGLPHVGDVDLTNMPHGWAGVGAAATLIFFAYIGFEEIVQLAEETKDPAHTMPRALLGSIAITTVLYVLVALAAVAVVGWEELAASDAPLAAVTDAALGSEASAALAMVALFSTGNTVLLLIVSAARLLWGMAEDGALPAGLARVGTTKKTPWVATLIVAGLAGGVMAMAGRIETIANLVNLALFATFLAMNASLIALRWKEPELERPFRVPGAIPVPGLPGPLPVLPVLGIASVVVMAVSTGVQALGIGLVVLATGAAVYFGRR